MLSINMSDVMNVLNSIKSYLIAFVVVLILAIVVMIAVGKQPKANKRLIRGEACIAIVLALLIVVNLICTGPMRTMLELVSARSDLSAETTAEATELVSKIVEEGVVLAKNEDAVLPVASGSKLNVFGWASTSPCYGGTGSGALNTAYPVTDLLTGLNEAGIETNTELSQFYTDYQSTRPDVGMWAQDWTLPEPNVSLYTDELMDNAKAFSDTAMIVITRVGGEGADLPDNMPAVVDGSWHGQDGVNQSDETYYAGVYDDTMNEGNDWDEGDHFLQLDNREEEMVELVCQNFDKVIVVYNGANAFELGWVNGHPQMDTAGWYGPAMNIHRTAFAGRNFEYYSEDGILSGSIAASAIKGAQEHGVYAYMKHFALNDQEANRCSMLCTWSNEQAMREIYLRPFELSVKEGDSLAVMSSFNYIGNRWAGGTKQLCETVLRDEWGFHGFVETDYFGVYNYMSADQAIRNGPT